MHLLRPGEGLPLSGVERHQSIFMCGILKCFLDLIFSVVQPGSDVTTDPTAPSSLEAMSSAVPGVALLVGIINIRKYREGRTNRIKILSSLLCIVEEGNTIWHLSQHYHLLASAV